MIRDIMVLGDWLDLHHGIHSIYISRVHSRLSRLHKSVIESPHRGNSTARSAFLSGGWSERQQQVPGHT